MFSKLPKAMRKLLTKATCHNSVKRYTGYQMCCSVFIALKRSSTSNELGLAIYSFGAMLPLGFLPSPFPFPLPILDPTIYGRRLPVDYQSTSLAFSSPFLVMALHIYERLYEAAFLIIVNFWAPPHYIGL